MANGEFPDDVTQLIMSRLPVKSLVKFRSVSKSWKKTISDPRFVRMHLRKSKLRPTNSNLFLQKLMEYKLSSPDCAELFKFGNPFLLVRAELDENGIFRFRFEANLGTPTVREGSRRWEVIDCSCDGIMLVYDFYRGFTLWNPSTREESLLPLCHSLRTNPVLCGISYDPITLGDFKVVLVTNDCSYAVYSYHTGSWSEKRVFPFRYLRRSYQVSAGKCVDGVVYWVAAVKVDRVGVRVSSALKGGEIIYFDRRTEDFKTFPKPQGVTKDDSLNLVCLRGRLCVYRESGDHVRFWIKDDESSCFAWKELMVVENVKRLKGPTMDRFEPICFLLGGDDLVIQVGSTQFVVYSPSNKKFSPCPETHRSLLWNPYLPTLLFPSHK